MRITSFLWPGLTVLLSVGYLALGTAEQPTQQLKEVPDTAIHAGGYGVLALAAAESVRILGLGHAPILAATYAMTHGVLLEALQSTTRTRKADPRDLAWDAVGTIIVLAAWSLWRRRS